MVILNDVVTSVTIESNKLSIPGLRLLRTLFYNQTGLRPKDIIFLHNDFQSLKFGLRTKNASF